ncbi:Serine/threonine-protein phosphatase 5 [Diplonema papillatum]|nr:Serine/threonine-protein phosphatase 5 [Diplonema papillatum]
MVSSTSMNAQEAARDATVKKSNGGAERPLTKSESGIKPPSLFTAGLGGSGHMVPPQFESFVSIVSSPTMFSGYENGRQPSAADSDVSSNGDEDPNQRSYCTDSSQPFSPKLKPNTSAATSPCVTWRALSKADSNPAEAAKLWKEGMDLYNDGFYSRATVFFTRCIALQPLAEYLSSRSMAWLKAGNTINALKDAMQAVERSKGMIQRFLSGVKREENALFLEYYYRRGMCFAQQGGSMGSQLALSDFKVAATQSLKLGHWRGSDPTGWSRRKKEIVEQYEEEVQQIEEQRADAKASDPENYDSDDYETPDIERALKNARLMMVLDEITTHKESAAEGMVDGADEFKFDDFCWLSLPINHVTSSILLPSELDPHVLGRIFKEMEHGNLLHRNDFLGLIHRARKQYLSTPNLQTIRFAGAGKAAAKVSVVGDIHGQFHDLICILDQIGFPSPEHHIIFNGDFVDRGGYGVECVTVLLLLKVTFPATFHLTRGNHEDHPVNEQYHFLSEVLLKYGSCDVYHAVQSVFQLLPLGFVIQDKVMVVHGGIPSNPSTTIADIQKLDRRRYVPDSGVMCDLLWSDPVEENGVKPSTRGRGHLFGPDVTEKFLQTNGLLYVIRSHDVTNCVDEGYAFEQGGKVLTVFSAPNYCGSYGNRAAVAHVRIASAKMEPTFSTFGSVEPPSTFLGSHAPHPYHFNFSI